MTRSQLPPGRLRLFAALVGLIVVGSAVYLYLLRAETSTSAGGPTRVFDASQQQSLTHVRRGAHLAFRNMVPGPEYGRLAFAPLDDRDSRQTTLLECNRIYFTNKAGFCLTIARSPAGFRGYLIDSSLGITHTLDLPGMPSRTRVSRDSRRAAYTVFVAGDSYLATGLSTRTRVVDAASGDDAGDLESFTVTRSGQVIHAVDFNFWGVTFTRDSNRFYATLGTRGRTYLLEGDVKERALRVIGDDVECPSLSPDETRIAFKKKFGSGFEAWWQPALIDLSTREVRLLPEPKHIDDQIEWLDDGHILYAVGHSISAARRRSDIWVLATDGATGPTVFVADAESPAVVRP